MKLIKYTNVLFMGINHPVNELSSLISIIQLSMRTRCTFDLIKNPHNYLFNKPNNIFTDGLFYKH